MSVQLLWELHALFSEGVYEHLVTQRVSITVQLTSQTKWRFCIRFYGGVQSWEVLCHVSPPS